MMEVAAGAADPDHAPAPDVDVVLDLLWGAATGAHDAADLSGLSFVQVVNAKPEDHTFFAATTRAEDFMVRAGHSIAVTRGSRNRRSAAGHVERTSSHPVPVGLV